MDKKTLRSKMIHTRKSMDVSLANQLSQVICQKILNWDVYQKAACIIGYYPVNNEVDLRPVYNAALNSGKAVALPRITGPHKMDFIQITDFENLAAGYMGILEPMKNSGALINNGLMLTPGTAFCILDDCIGRMGYGGGYYDTFIREHRAGLTTCGIAYDFQIVNKDVLEIGPADESLDFLVSENGLTAIQKSEV